MVMRWGRVGGRIPREARFRFRRFDEIEGFSQGSPGLRKISYTETLLSDGKGRDFGHPL